MSVSDIDTVLAPKKVIAECNKLARTFYAMQGCCVPEDYKFYEASHPAEVGCWTMAVAAYEHILSVDIDNLMSEIEDDG